MGFFSIPKKSIEEKSINMKKLVKKYRLQKQKESNRFTGHLLPSEFISQERLDNMKTIEEFTKIYFKNERKDY